MRRRVRVDRRVGLLLGGVLLLAFVALGASVALPATDPDLEGKPQRLSRLEARGMEIYRGEGCWYCHTQYVRNSATDAAYGEPLDPGAYEGRSPAMLGTERVGPDLTHVASRFGDAQAVLALLRKGENSMPPYAYLGEDDLRALAAYLLSLR